MIENFSDAIGFYTTVFFVLAGIYLLFVVSSRHHEQILRKREEAYYNLLDEIGWKAVVDLKDYSDQINEDGTVKFFARITKEDGTVLTEKYAIAIYKGE